MLSTLYIFNQIRKDPPDIVHLFWGHYPTMIGYLVNRYMHNTVLTMFLGAYDLKKRYGGSIALGKHVDAVFTLSKSNIEQLRSLGISDNLYLVYGGIHIEDNSLFTPGKFKEIEKSVFITASRLIKEKCVDDILILFSAILKNNIGSKLLILGDGPERKYLETKAALLGISASTEFKGHIPHNEVLSHMSKSHFFVLMSKEDNLPNALKEAMYQQCVCIASETTGINELISNGKNGFVIEQHNVNTAAKIINDLLSDSKRCTAIAQNARQTIISNFNVNNTIQEYINIWEKALCAKLKNRKTGTYPC